MSDSRIIIKGARQTTINPLDKSIPEWRQQLPFPVGEFQDKGGKKIPINPHLSPEAQLTPQQLMQVQNAVHFTQRVLGGTAKSIDESREEAELSEQRLIDIGRKA